MAKIIEDVSVKLRDESRATVGADGVQVFRVQVRSGDPNKHDAFLQGGSNRIYAEIQYVSVGYGF